ncbi:MAG TPA: hypothetical protein VM692_15175 [Gammaproteobacteria bacterium]|nr:hypothetical protein [Gammaproteobacteria bacterium]
MTPLRSTVALRLRVAVWLAASLGATHFAAAHELELASIEQARAVLGTSDDFVAHMSPFDRAARVESGDAVSVDEYLAFARAAGREWSNDERARLAAAFAAIEPKLEELLPELDRPILLVKTSGQEEGGAGYTRGNAVMLPQAHEEELQLQHLLAHEIFHVVSRNNPDLKRALYRGIGFEECGELVLPPALAARKMTNPDAPVNEHCIEIAVDGEKAWGMPILLSREERFDPDAGRAFFEYLTLSMLLVDRGSGATRPLERNGAPVLVPFNRVQGLGDKIGHNTNYVIHAEEILASNFELLVMGAPDAPSPEVLERIRTELTSAVARR